MKTGFQCDFSSAPKQQPGLLTLSHVSKLRTYLLLALVYKDQTTGNLQSVSPLSPAAYPWVFSSLDISVHVSD